MRKPAQGELPLWRGTWGGFRPGSGRKRSKKPPIPHEPREPFPARHPCHVTLKVREGIGSLGTVAVVKQVESTFRLCTREDLRLVHYSIQGDHLHAIVEAEGTEALGRGMKSLAARFARAVNRALRRAGPVLRERYHLVVLTTPTQVRNALRYLLLNARRHAAKRGMKLRGAVCLDPASARWFDGWRRERLRVEEARAPDPPAVRRPRTWLPGVGWKRLGLLDSGEVPG